MEAEAQRNGADSAIPDGEYLVATVPEKEYSRGMFSLLIQDCDGTAQRHELAQGGTTIGRNPENTIVLADGSVSSRHAEIMVEVGKAILRDLNSSNGTTVNGAAVTEIALTVGDEIVFGSVVCRAEASSISEVPPPLPAIAPAPTRDEVAPPPPVKEPQVQINTGQEPTSPAQNEAPAPTVSFWSKLLAFGKAASQETKRAVQIAGTKAKNEKLKRIDLSNAHYELGKKCYELRLHEDKFPTERAAIAELEKRIKEKQEGDTAEENETTGGKLKRMAGNAKQSVEAKGLSMNMNQLLTGFGKQIAECGIAPAEVSAELTGVEKVNEAIRHAEEELTKLSADMSQRAQMKSLTGSISSDAGAGAKSGFRGFVSLIKAHPKPALTIVIILCVSFVTYKFIKSDILEQNGKREGILLSEHASDLVKALQEDGFHDGGNVKTQKLVKGEFRFVMNRAADTKVCGLAFEIRRGSSQTGSDLYRNLMTFTLLGGYFDIRLVDWLAENPVKPSEVVLSGWKYKVSNINGLEDASRVFGEDAGVLRVLSCEPAQGEIGMKTKHLPLKLDPALIESSGRKLNDALRAGGYLGKKIGVDEHNGK